MDLQILVHIADDASEVINAFNRDRATGDKKLTEEEQLQKILSGPIR